MQFVDIGFGHVAAVSRILCIASTDSAPIRRVIQDARDRSVLIDGCSGKKCRSVLVMDTDHVVLSSLQVEEIKAKIEANKEANDNE